MIPLAQFLADDHGDEFVPLRATPPRRPAQAPAAAAARSLETALPRVAERPAAPRSLPVAAMAVPAAAPVRAPAPRVVTEPRVPLRELEAERIAWAMERNALREEMLKAVAEARAAGRAEGQDEVRQDLERVSQDRIETLRTQLASEHGLAMEETRRQWVDAEGDRLADLVVLQMAVFEDALRTTLQSLLRPLLTDARKRQTVDELAGAVKTIAFDGNAVKIAASGPSDLLNALETKLGDHARHVSFATDETHTDVRIDANQTVIETRLAAWLKAVEEALS